ncbi:MAG: LssY C-terminal domain-containing protein, partial [Gammaproteobacteria bacterium]
VYYAFLRAGWDETEVISRSSLMKMAKSFITGSEYRYSPVSGLYLFDRPQDVAFQKARDNIDERNHLRLWMSPLRFEGVPVWIGQISRDIGVRLTAKTITTHKIDPDVDETREYLVENLAYSQALAKLGYVDGVGEATIDAPRANLTGDPYITDGKRVVLWISSQPKNFGEIEDLDWGAQPIR